MKITRNYSDLSKYLKPGKVLVIFGPRQVGKTTLIKDFLSNYPKKYKLDTGENISTQQALGSFIMGDSLTGVHKLGTRNIEELKEYIAGYDLIAIDEAQNIPGVGTTLKIMVDHFPEIQVIATGSASFELAGQVGEPLTGRKTTITLFPIAQMELKKLYNQHELKNKLEEFLIFGGYPEVVATEGRAEKEKILRELTDSYLLKDILALERVKSSKILLDLLRMLAFQLTKEVSLTELGTNLGIDYKTVARYIDLLEKSFIIFNLRGFSGNLRKEIRKKSKYYFYDNGVRNALIANFNKLELRNDIGELWENFCFMERFKKQSYQQVSLNQYFWREKTSEKEIDLIEEREGELFAYEFKWQDEKIKPPKGWVENYPDGSYKVISAKNYLEFMVD